MLINITGGNDLTLFEVDQSVNKIRAEVDPEAELIFGAIKDEGMTGRIRVSIVATALDGYKTENKTVLNMVSRLQNRNTGYSDNLFSHNTRIEKNTLNSIDGATALRLDENYELEEDQSDLIRDVEKENSFENASQNNQATHNIPKGVSIESASYIENHNLDVKGQDTTVHINEDEEFTPQLFSDDQSYQSNENLEHEEKALDNSKQLFDQDLNEEDDFEIPAFLRKQKF